MVMTKGDVLCGRGSPPRGHVLCSGVAEQLLLCAGGTGLGPGLAPVVPAQRRAMRWSRELPAQGAGCRQGLGF